MKILLAYQSGTNHRNDPYINLVPTGLCYLHASLREAGYDSLLANFSAWPTPRIKRELLAVKPDIIGISQWTHNNHASLDLARICRELLPDCMIIFGGGHATFRYEDILTEGSPVDVVVCGEGESTLLELVAHAQVRSEWPNINGLAFRTENGIHTTHARTNLAELDRLPIPANHLDISVGVDLELQPEFIVTTRGCPSTCHFCSSPDFWGRKVRFRSPASIIEEIQYITKKFGVIYFSIRDDTFTADRTRVLEFCRLLQQKKVDILWNCQSRVTAIDEELVTEMKRTGCECIQLGVESGSPRILKQLGKNITPEKIEQACEVIRTLGINLSIYLISDVTGETSEDILQTVHLIRRIHPDDGYVSPLAYYPGTQLYKEAVSTGIIAPDIFAKSHQDACYVASTHSGTAARLLKELAKNKSRDPSRFKRQKEVMGYCFTTNIIAAEWYRQRGEYDKAELELVEITAMQPGNPWGWLLLGDLNTEIGRVKKGAQFYAKVLSIVPQHGPSKLALTIT